MVDSARAGSTQLFDSGAFADLVPLRRSTKPAAKTGGRLVCLTDGREYTVGEGALSFGREAGADVVVGRRTSPASMPRSSGTRRDTSSST